MEQLEKDLLEWIAGNNDCEALATQLAGARVTKRDYMRTGFFIFLEAPKDAAPIEANTRVCCPDLEAPGLMHGAGSSLFFRGGRLHYLEIYARGGFFPEQPESYRLHWPAE
ncbi:MAG: hypothetical protein P8Y61_01075 [Gammaproteobacteria bacterium]|jgi:hypothetical protein